MSDTQKRTTAYAITAAVSIGILAIAVATYGPWTNTQVVPAANGNSVVTPNDDCIPGGKIHCIDTIQPGRDQGITGTVAFEGNDSDNAFELFVTGSAFRKISPDKVSVTLGVETQEKTAQDAAIKNAQAMNAIIDALKKLELNANQISTSYYSIYPVYEYNPIVEPQIYPPQPQNPVLVGYRVSNTITVTAQASADIGEIIDSAVDSGANQVQGVNYFVSQEVQMQTSNELIGEAVQNARLKAEKALEPLNMQIVGVKNLSLNDVYYPVYGYDKAVFEGGAAPTPILPSEQQVSASVSVTFLIGAG